MHADFFFLITVKFLPQYDKWKKLAVYKLNNDADGQM